MTCPRCETLQAELASARQLLDAWSARSQQESAEDQAVERLGRWQAELELTVSEARLLLALVDRPGVTLSAERLGRMIRPPLRKAIDVGSNLIEVTVYRVRRALKAARLACALETVKGAGYVITPHAALIIKARMGEA